MAWWDFKIFIGVLVSIVVVGFCIIPLIKTICCIWPRVKPGEPISCTKKPCCWYFHFWENESKYIYLIFTYLFWIILVPEYLQIWPITFSMLIIFFYKSWIYDFFFLFHFVLAGFFSCFSLNKRLDRHFVIYFDLGELHRFRI